MLLKTKEKKSAAPSSFSITLNSRGANVVIMELSSIVDAPSVGSSDESSGDDGDATMFDASLHGPHDKGTRDYIISKSMCVCGATNVMANGLLPNETLRDTINRILELNAV
ncbi:hypothetical protein AMTRI_Chr13g116490 [Amborella trichopoda]